MLRRHLHEALTVMLKTKSYSYFDRLDSYKVKNLNNQEFKEGLNNLLLCK